jgi:hypothetical protein
MVKTDSDGGELAIGRVSGLKIAAPERKPRARSDSRLKGTSKIIHSCFDKLSKNG